MAFATIQDVKDLTGGVVEAEHIFMAQKVIEAVVGRVEAEVTNFNDLELLRLATAYQAAYYIGDGERVFGQAKVTQTMAYGNMVAFPNDGLTPFVAPLAIIACRGLTWRKTRSVKTGGIFGVPVDYYRWDSE